ncbi:hypothetical protein BDQ12DRAFT_714927 [Crucibulum laeve]|uniref:Uncharacterized protein n=1 Tax=Crucibulum laeve TaxID=68775 RepID=A0A5C3LRW8_9AGAR|nr:hypothetical protein BDQ12DRAFT_714927 [Crucibulum laeve]
MSKAHISECSGSAKFAFLPNERGKAQADPSQRGMTGSPMQLPLARHYKQRQLYKNRDDYKCLTESIVAILKHLEQDVQQNPTAALASEQFKEQCKEVEKRVIPIVCAMEPAATDVQSSFLRTITNVLQAKFHHSNMNGFKEMWRSGSLRDLIAQYQREVDRMCINLILRNSNHMRIRLEGNDYALAQSTEKGDTQSLAVEMDDPRLSDFAE